MVGQKSEPRSQRPEVRGQKSEVRGQKSEVRKVLEGVRKAHEGGVDGSKGWEYKWDEEIAKKVLLRTHTTSLSARKLMEIGKSGEFPAKYFALG
ncbi:MAG: hypothetical protein KAQ78_01420, partial [Candidatus Latescibacteria bacterium]|nr:hypothetical protein [Candidatus Latescibacterota bacterium]